MQDSVTRWVTVRAAARELGLSYDRVRRLLFQRQLKGTQSGDRYGPPRVNVCDLKRLHGASFLLALGRENSVPNYGCTVDVTGRTAGTYTGTITATVAVL